MMAHVPPKLGPFEPLHRLGAGGMAETFVAVRRGPAGFEQRVCIKRILPAYESDLDFVASFLEEARTSAALRHANIVQVVDFGMNESDGSHYLALELVDGMDLRALMQREHAFDPELVTLVALELAAALAHAHAEDEGRPAVVHRDLSPSNVLVSRAGEIKLTDFGIARVIGGAHRTASGVIKGKVPYMPPEYIDGGLFDARGDLFSLGVMLFELCHGQRPFDGNSELDTMRRIVAGERRAFEASAPPALVACVECLLQRQPQARFQSALALLDALPPIAVHATRRRLADLVRGRPSLPHFASVIPSRLGATSAPLAATLPLGVPRAGEQATRTIPRRQRLAVAKPALIALAAALAVFAVIAFAALLRSGKRPLSAAAVPSLPVAPAHVLTAESSAGVDPRRDLPPGASDHSGLSPTEPPSQPAPTQPPRTLASAALPSADTSSVRSTEPVRGTGTSRHAAELRVVVYPYGDVWVDAKYAGQSPLSLRLPPGKHEIAVGEGRARERRIVRLHAGESESITFRPPSSSTP